MVALIALSYVVKKGRSEMSYRSSTLRRLPPHTRKLARLINDLDSVERRLKNYLETVRELELWAKTAQAQAKFSIKDQES